MKLIINVLYRGARIDTFQREIRHPTRSHAQLSIDMTETIDFVRDREQPPKRSRKKPKTRLSKSATLP